MRYRFIEAEKASFAVRWLCRVLRVSRSGFYGWRLRPLSARAREVAHLEANVRMLHRASRQTYGSPRIVNALREDGETCGRHRVARIMRHAGIRAKTVRRFKATSNSQHRQPVAENLLTQDFNASQVNQRWVSDITYIPTQQGWLYLAVVLDLYSHAIVGWAMDNG